MSFGHRLGVDMTRLGHGGNRMPVDGIGPRGHLDQLGLFHDKAFVYLHQIVNRLSVLVFKVCRVLCNEPRVFWVETDQFAHGRIVGR